MNLLGYIIKFSIEKAPKYKRIKKLDITVETAESLPFKTVEDILKFGQDDYSRDKQNERLFQLIHGDKTESVMKSYARIVESQTTL